MGAARKVRTGADRHRRAELGKAQRPGVAVEVPQSQRFGNPATVKMIETPGWWTYIGVDRELPFDFVLELDGTRFASSDASFSSYSYGNIYRWEGTGLSLRDGDTVEVRLHRAFEDETAVNSAATGAPIISGTVQVGETLTADTSGIEDAGGLDNAAFTYQWLADRFCSIIQGR